MDSKSTLVQRVTDHYTSHWVPNKKFSGSHLEQEAQRIGIKADGLYGAKEGSTFFKNDYFSFLAYLREKTLIPDFNAHANKNRKSFGFRFMFVDQDRPSARSAYQIAITDSQLELPYVLQNVFHIPVSERKLIEELKKQGLLRSHENAGYVTGKSTLELFKQVMQNITPEDLGINSFPTIDIPSETYLPTLLPNFHEVMIPRIQGFNQDAKDFLDQEVGCQNVNLNEWYEITLASRILRSQASHLTKILQSQGIEIKENEQGDQFIPGYALPLYAWRPHVDHTYTKTGPRFFLIDLRYRIKEKIGELLNIEETKTNTLLETGHLEVDRKGLKIGSLQNVYDQLISMSSPIDLGIDLIDFKTADSNQIHFQEYSTPSLPKDQTIEFLYPTFKTNVLGNLPQLAQIYDLDLSQSYKTSEIASRGMADVSIRNSDNKHNFLHRTPITHPKSFYGPSVAVLLGKRRFHTPTPIEELSFYKESDIEQGVSPFTFTEEQIQQTLASRILKETEWSRLKPFSHKVRTKIDKYDYIFHPTSVYNMFDLLFEKLWQDPEIKTMYNIE
ncbi:hypothetical protein HN789_01765 [archaeon]|jgi:hypothetical protein|nr:hypothetical protein [archaeon]MBT4022542.1 hypothetical protein [archaeon]MBT4272868.1 hypothetical protein [archaeon]MBT4461668.1 hypothetical protein [archaeon]MBT4857564.1 hypothetical protein [archaeon]